ncbi:MAG: hypothetical protein WD602_04825 [Actinomycetota bacterium]
MLTVTGECRLPATFRSVLEKREPQGDDPSQLILDLVISNPSGFGHMDSEGRCTLNVSFKMQTDKEYDSVLIVDRNSEEEGGESWEVPVRVLVQEVAAAPVKGTKWSALPRDYTK